MSNEKKSEVIGWIRLQKTRDGKREFLTVSFKDGGQGTISLFNNVLTAVREDGVTEDKEGNEVKAEFGKTIVGVVRRDNFKPSRRATKSASRRSSDEEIPF